MTDQLRLGASFKDDASPNVRKLRGELQRLNEETKEGREIAKLNREITKLRSETSAFNATPGMKAAEQWFKSSAGAASTFVTAGGGVAGVLGTIGLGALGAAGSMVGLVGAMKDIGSRSLDMKELARQTGVTVEYLSKFESAGQSFGLSTDTMDRALKSMAAELPKIKAGVSPLIGFFASQGLPDLAKKLGTEDTAHALDDILHQLDQIKNPAVRSKVLGDILGTPELEAIFGHGGYKGFVEMFNKQKPLQLDPAILEQAQALREAQKEFNREMERFETTIGPPFLKMMTTLVELGTKGVELFSHPKELVPKVGKLTPEEADKLKKGREDFDKNIGWNPLNWFHFGKRTAFEGGDKAGGGGLLHLASFERSSASFSGDPVDALAEGTKRGFILAFRELTSMGSAAPGAETPNLVKAMYSDGGGGFAAGTSGRGGGSRDGGFDGPVPLGGRAGSLTKLIDEEARRAGIDPRVMEGIRAGESLHRGTYDKKDDAIESSWGPFQLNRRRGLGVQFERDTGLDLRDPSSIAAQARWVAQYLKRGGSLGAWSGYHGPRDANPRWGESGYVPNPEAGERAAPNRGTGSGIGLHLRTLSEQCVDLARAAVGASGTVREWRRGVGAIEGTLKPGTPIATFLDKAGRASERYAGGGIGTMGAHRDHAGIFQSYIRDKNGKPIGFNMAEQYKGSHGAHSKAYMFGRGWGEGNASNYSAITGPDGQPLGGDRNPMSRRATGLPHPAAEASRAPAAPSHVHLEIEHPAQSRVRLKGSTGPITTAFKRQWGRHDWSMTEA